MSSTAVGLRLGRRGFVPALAVTVGLALAVGGVGVAEAYADEAYDQATSAPAAIVPQDNDIPVPGSEVAVGTSLRGAATRAAAPTLEYFGVNSVEESGQFVTATAVLDEETDLYNVTTTNIYNWNQPKYAFVASSYQASPSAFLANLANHYGGQTTSQAIWNPARSGDGAGPNQALSGIRQSTVTARDKAIYAYKPQIILGTGSGVTYNIAYTGYTGAQGVPYEVSNGYNSFILNMRNTEKAILNAGGTLRYGTAGSATNIANAYENYIKGSFGTIATAISSGEVNMKTVALVVNVRQAAGVGYEYEIVTKNGALSDGTANVNRYLEATCMTRVTKGTFSNPIAMNLADQQGSSADTVWVSPTELNKAHLILVGGQQSSANYSAIMTALRSQNMIGKTYFTANNNATAGSLYGVVMNSADNAQNLGRILGMLYPNQLSQQDMLAYYYETFYHISTNRLAEVMNGALNGSVRNATVTANDPVAAVQWSLTAPYTKDQSAGTVGAALSAAAANVTIATVK